MELTEMKNVTYNIKSPMEEFHIRFDTAKERVNELKICQRKLSRMQLRYTLEKYLNDVEIWMIEWESLTYT